MGEKLSLKEKAHLLFLVNICGGAHFLIIEKNNCWCRIFQSWQGQFTLAEWIGVQPWTNKEFQDEFLEYGRGEKITCGQLIKYLQHLINLAQARMQQFRDLMLAIPYELEITVFVCRR